MKLLALSVLLMLACAAFGKAVNEAPAVQEEENTEVEGFEQVDEQAEDEYTAVAEGESNVEVEGESNVEAEGFKCLKYSCRNSVSKRICYRIKNNYKKGHFLHGRRLVRCFIVYKRSCHQICYYV